MLGLYRGARQYHLHLDWRTLDQWLYDPAFVCVLQERNAGLGGAMGASLCDSPYLDQPPAAWLRFFAADHRAGREMLRLLWDELHAGLVARGVGRAACAVVDDWVVPHLREWGFAPFNAVINMQRNEGIIPAPPAPPLKIVEVTPAMLEEVVRVDALAFQDQLWAYSRETLEVAWKQAGTFTALWLDDQIVGYQLSTAHFGNAHLARLAVLPEYQGRGYGGLLIGEMLRWFERRKVRQITVNTQGDNYSSQRLYARLGFVPLGEDVPIWVIEL